LSGHGHHESSSGGPASEMINFFFMIFACFWFWLDDEVLEMIDKPNGGGHNHH